ncbi:hypothetical protein B6U70_01680 [Euryarchaeota archaeon ex4484_162]|nr:MAG: hypothetical protein B6U70_01680 [Euryarchaeota archaeon ex4484_162]
MEKTEIEIKILTQLRNWDNKHLNSWLSREDFKKMIDEENDDIVDQYVRELEEEGYVKLNYGIGAYFHDIRITKKGRDLLKSWNV